MEKATKTPVCDIARCLFFSHWHRVNKCTGTKRCRPSLLDTFKPGRLFSSTPISLPLISLPLLSLPYPFSPRGRRRGTHSGAKARIAAPASQARGGARHARGAGRHCHYGSRPALPPPWWSARAAPPPPWWSSCMACMVAGEKSKLPGVRRKPGPRPPRHIDPPRAEDSTSPYSAHPPRRREEAAPPSPRLVLSAFPPRFLLRESFAEAPAGAYKAPPPSPPPARRCDPYSERVTTRDGTNGGRCVLHAARRRRRRLRQAQIRRPRCVRLRLPVPRGPG